jgi:cold shock CspA family protein
MIYNTMTDSSTYIGVVTWYNKRKGYGFIRCAGSVTDNSINLTKENCENLNNNYFAHVSNITAGESTYVKLLENEVVYFNIETDSNGKTKCVNVRGFNDGKLICEPTRQNNVSDKSEQTEST